MKTIIDVPDYTLDHGLRTDWDEGFAIRVHSEGDTILIVANPAGLRSLARHLLVLAQQGVPSGHHIHLDSSNSLEDGSNELILQRE